MTLSAKQHLFTRLLGKLLVYIYTLPGHTASIREVQRSKLQAEANAAAGIGIAKSLHISSLAAAIMLFRDNEFLVKPEDYKVLGDYWLSLDPRCRWGGNFSKPDAVHFSIEHEGRA